MSNDDVTTRQYGELMTFLNGNEDMRKNAKNSLKASIWAGGGACKYD